MHGIVSLDPAFSNKVCKVLEACKAEGAEMRVYCTLRTPQEQAKLWRQSRSSEAIASKIAELRKAGAHYLADVLHSVGPQFGQPVTNAIPGLSWHQWGLAVDAFWVVDGRACWSTRQGGDDNGYRVWAREAQVQGLVAGGHWKRFKDWPHIQQPSNGVLAVYSLQEVDREMQQRFAT